MSDIFNISQHDTLFASRTGPEEWARISAFRDRPHYLEGVRLHAGVMQPFFAYNLILNKVVAEIWRFQMLVFTLYLHETWREDDPRSGLNLGNLQRVCSNLNLASPGRVYAFLNIMKIGGYLEKAPTGADNRVSRLAPTRMFMNTVEEWNRGIWAAIDATNPGGGLVALGQAYPSLGTGMRNSGAEGLLAGWDPLGPFPEVSRFAASDGGWMMMEHIVSEALGSNGRLRRVTINCDLRRTAKQFGGSRSNLIRLLGEAHDLGLLEIDPRLGREVRFTTTMTSAFLTFLASFLGYFELHTQMALERIRTR